MQVVGIPVGIPGAKALHTGGLLARLPGDLPSCVKIHVTNKGAQKSHARGTFNTIAELPRCPCCFCCGTLLVPTITCDRRMLSRPLAIRSTILASLRCWAVATRMCAFVAILFGHDLPPCSSNTTPRDRAQCFWGSRQHTPYAPHPQARRATDTAINR